MKRALVLLLLGVPLLADPPFTPNVRVSQDPPNLTVNQGESSFAVWHDSIYVVCNIAERSVYPMIPFARSISNGDSFELHYEFIDQSTGITWHTDPVIAVDDSGHVHMLVQFSVDLIRHYLSRDGGITWAETTNVSDPATGGWVDKPWMVVDGNHVYVAWQEFYSAEQGIRFARSDDYGRTFTVQTVDPNHTGLVALNINRNTGTLYMVYVAWGSGLYFTRSDNGGFSWWSPTWIGNVQYDGGIGDRAPIVSLAVYGDTLFVSWVDDRNGSWDILGMRSLNGGLSWEGPWILNHTLAGGQCKSWVTFDPYSGLHLFYYSTPDWPTQLGSQWSVWYRYSSDFGQTWDLTARITDTTFLGHYFQDNTNFMGDYHMIVADSHYVYAVWTDGRDGNMNLYFAKAPLSEVSVAERQGLRIPELRVHWFYRDGLPWLHFNVSRSIESLDLTLYNITGRRLWSRTLQLISPGAHRLPLGLSNPPTGLYLLRLRTPSGQQVTKTLWFPTFSH